MYASNEIVNNYGVIWITIRFELCKWWNENLEEKERYEDGIPEHTDSTVRVSKPAVVCFRALQEVMGNIPQFYEIIKFVYNLD